MDLNGSRIGTGTYPCCAPTGFTVKQSVKTDWLFTIRPRLGVADMIPNTLIYATGGLAMTNLNYQAVFTDTFATAHESGGLNRTVVGWTAGAGGEFQVAPHWSIKGEYLYVDFGKSTTHSTNLTAFTPPIAFPSNEWTHSTDLRASIFRVGANYHF